MWPCSYISPIWFWPCVICRSHDLPLLPPATFLPLPPSSIPGGLYDGGKASPCRSRLPVSTSVSADTGTCCVVFQAPGVQREPGREQGRRKQWSGFLSLLRILRLVLCEQSLIRPTALSGTQLPGLNNECAGLPLALRALIISQGPVFSHVEGIRG